MTTMADMALGFARLSAMLGPCAHPEAVPVDLLVTGERVAWLCPNSECGVQLPADWAESGPLAEDCDCRRCVTGSEWWPVCNGQREAGG